jgi:deferrochelatase/peroxidase EfeB
MDGHVWVGREAGPPWLAGGSYLVARKIRIFVENWDRDYLQDQENVIGRAKLSGAPLTGGTEFTRPDFAARDARGQPVIPADAHLRLASFEHNGGTRILRRGYSFTDGIDTGTGTLLGGLFFIAFMKEPRPVHPAAERARRRCPERIRPPHRQRGLRLPAGPAPRPALGRQPVHLTTGGRLSRRG